MLCLYPRSDGLEATRLDVVMILSICRHLGSAGAEVPAKFISNWKSLKISRLRDFTSFALGLPSAWWIDWPGLSNIYSIVKVALVNVFVVIHVDMKPVSGNEEPHVSSPWHVINVPATFLCAAKTSCHFYCILWEIGTSYGVLNLHLWKASWLQSFFPIRRTRV